MQEEDIKVLTSEAYGKVISQRNEINRKICELWDDVLDVVDICRYTPEGKHCLTHDQEAICSINMMEIMLSHFDDDGQPLV